MTPFHFEKRICGESVIEVGQMKQISIYPNCQPDHEIVRRFWNVFAGFDYEERAKYLNFVWGRSKLPRDLAKVAHKHEVRLVMDMPPASLPRAHTCFNQLDIPFYRSDEVCRKKLLQAAENCSGLDVDVTNFTALTEE